MASIKDRRAENEKLLERLTQFQVPEKNVLYKEELVALREECHEYLLIFSSVVSKFRK